MKIYDFTAPELAYYKKFCNFDSREAALYDLRAKNIPLEECAEILGYENIRKLSLRVNRKIDCENDRYPPDAGMDRYCILEE